MLREEDIHTCPAAYVSGCEAGSWGGSLSDVAVERLAGERCRRGAAGRRTVAEYGGGHPHLPGSVCHGLRGRQRGGQRGNVCTTVFSSPLVGWISEYIGLIIPFAVFEDLPGSVCLWQRGRQGGGRRKPVTDGFPPASGKGVTGELSSGPPPGMDRSVLKDRSREESACEKSVALIRRPAQDLEQP